MPGEKARVYVIAAAGGNPEAITASGDRQPARGSPMWSPDGNSVIFGEVGDQGLDRTTRIFRVDLDTRKVSFLPGSEGLLSPHWSSDGRYVVAMTIDFQKLMLFDFRAQKWSELAKGSALGFPEWPSDSKYVFYIDFVPLVCYRVDIGDHKIERVANLEQTRNLKAGRYGAYYGVAPDGSPLFLRNTGFQEIYALDVDLP